MERVLHVAKFCMEGKDTQTSSPSSAKTVKVMDFSLFAGGFNYAIWFYFRIQQAPSCDGCTLHNTIDCSEMAHFQVHIRG